MATLLVFEDDEVTVGKTGEDGAPLLAEMGLAVCEFCNAPMEPGGRCIANMMVVYLDGYLCETLPYDGQWTGTWCHDCNVRAGERHHPGCDVERCPRCGDGGQMLGCGFDGRHAPVVASLTYEMAHCLLFGCAVPDVPVLVKSIDWRNYAEALVGRLEMTEANAVEVLNARLALGHGRLRQALKDEIARLGRKRKSALRKAQRQANGK